MADFKINPGAQAFGRVVVLGGGAWGTALALVAARAGRMATIWARDAAIVTAINRDHQNPRYLPGLPIDEAVSATMDAACVEDADLIIVSVPAQSLRRVLAPIAALVQDGTPVVSAAKGLEADSLATMTQVIGETVGHARPAVLSGPSFATDVARDLPTALTIAAQDVALADQIARTLASARFRPYASTDTIGVELGGALKNVIAIASGIVSGAALGASAQAAITARGFAEIARLGERLGAQPATLMGLSGLGDLVLSTSSLQSRNFSLGRALGAGGDISQLTGAGTKLAEGAFTASVALQLAASVEMDLPITRAVADVLAGKLAVRAAVDGLMTRPLRSESL